MTLTLHDSQHKWHSTITLYQYAEWDYAQFCVYICCYAECRYDECRYADCRGATVVSFLLSL